MTILFKAQDFRINYIRDGVTPTKVFEAYATQAAEDASHHLTKIGSIVFDHIKHGDDEHQAWLRRKVEELFGTIDG